MWAYFRKDNLMKKYIIKGRTYTVTEELPNPDNFITYMAKVKNSKKEEFTLIKSYSKYSLYDVKKNKVLTTYSIREA